MSSKLRLSSSLLKKSLALPSSSSSQLRFLRWNSGLGIQQQQHATAIAAATERVSTITRTRNYSSTCHRSRSMNPTSSNSRRFFRSSSIVGSSIDDESSSAVTLKDSYKYIKVEKNIDDGVGIITLDRPKQLNALCNGLFDDLIHAGKCLDNDNDIGCLIVTGNEKAFAAGADISEMVDKKFAEVYKENMFSHWNDFSKLSKPVIAAVNGYCLGGGCELAMMCDMIVAGENAKFGQPEINLGIIPGAGGTQRLTKAIGKSKAMYMVLTGDVMTAHEMHVYGLVAKIFPTDALLEESHKIGKKIASKGTISTIMAKEAINAAYELSLQDGLHFERRLFHSAFATHDQKEGMTAFVEKRKPKFE